MRGERSIYFVLLQKSDVSYRVCDFLHREKSFNFVTIKPEIFTSSLKSTYVN